MSEKIKEMMDVTLEKIKAMATADTIIGNPIHVEDTTILPVSKVTYGFASGGSDFAAKNQPGKDLFGGGGGAGMTVTPVAFLAIHNDNVKVLSIDQSGDGNAIVNLIPELFDKVTSLFKKDEKDKDTSEQN